MDTFGKANEAGHGMNTFGKRSAAGDVDFEYVNTKRLRVGEPSYIFPPERGLFGQSLLLQNDGEVVWVTPETGEGWTSSGPGYLQASAATEISLISPHVVLGEEGATVDLNGFVSADYLTIESDAPALELYKTGTANNWSISPDVTKLNFAATGDVRLSLRNEGVQVGNNATGYTLPKDRATAAKMLLRSNGADEVKWSLYDHADLQNVGTNTHAQIDSHISSSALHWNGLTKTMNAGEQLKWEPSIVDSYIAANIFGLNIRSNNKVDVVTNQLEVSNELLVQGATTMNSTLNCIGGITCDGYLDVNTDAIIEGTTTLNHTVIEENKTLQINSNLNQNYIFPLTRGSAGQVLTANGGNSVVWSATGQTLQACTGQWSLRDATIVTYFPNVGNLN